MIRKMWFADEKDTRPRIGNLVYGATVCGLPGHPDVIYIKVKTRSPGMGIKISKSNGHSVLLNMKCGTLREVRGDTRVRVLDADVELSDVKPECLHRHTKDGC